MKPETLFECLENLDPSILEESEAPVRRRWKRLAAAACVCVAGAGVFAALHLGSGMKWSAPAETAAYRPVSSASAAMPDPNPSQGNPKPADPVTPLPEPEETPQRPLLIWNEAEASADAIPAMGVVVVSEPLTKQQIAMTAPDEPPEWLVISDGYASYYLKDGEGGLQSVILTVKHSLRGIEATVQIFDPGSPRYGSCVMEPEPETASGSYEGLPYTAYQYSYRHGEGDPALYPPVEWLSLTLEFQRGDAAYRLSAEAPAEMETDAKNALADILYCYAHSDGIPDLGSFHCREYLLRDEVLTLEEARADADFGAYLPEIPDGFPECDIRRYRFEEVQNYLDAAWYGGYDHVDWFITYAGEKDFSRLVSPEDKALYDLSLYPVPWAESVPGDKWETVNNPVFRAEELTPELVQARAYTVSDAGDTAGWRIQLSVLFPNSILLRIETKGVSPEWIYGQISALR